MINCFFKNNFNQKNSFYKERAIKIFWFLLFYKKTYENTYPSQYYLFLQRTIIVVRNLIELYRNLREEVSRWKQ